MSGRCCTYLLIIQMRGNRYFEVRYVLSLLLFAGEVYVVHTYLLFTVVVGIMRTNLLFIFFS